MRAAFVVLTAGLVLTAACGGAAETIDREETPTAPSAPTASPNVTIETPPGSNSACTAFPSGVRAGQTVVRTLSSGERERSYRLHVPRGARASTRLPIVLNFHGLGSSAEQQEPYSGLVPVSDREGFLLATPDGSGIPRAWSSFRALSTGADDILFVSDLLDALEAEFCVDSGAVFATGMSNGAFMSSLLGCALEERIAAIAPVAGLYYPGEDCDASVAVLAFHGVEDSVVPYAGGNVLGLLQYQGAIAALEQWAGRGGCEPEFTEKVVAKGVTQRALTGCVTAPVSLITIDGGGHTWPGAPVVSRLGATTQEISAAELIWAFFKANRR